MGVNTSEMLGGADGGADLLNYSHRREYKV